MSQGPIKEPIGVDFIVAGRALTSQEDVLLKAFIQKNRLDAKFMHKELEALRKRLLERPTPTWTEVLKRGQGQHLERATESGSQSGMDLDVDSRDVTPEDLARISKRLKDQKSLPKRPSGSRASKAGHKATGRRSKVKSGS